MEDSRGRKRRKAAAALQHVRGEMCAADTVR